MPWAERKKRYCDTCGERVTSRSRNQAEYRKSKRHVCVKCTPLTYAPQNISRRALA